VVKGHDRDGIRELAEEGGVAWLGDDSEELAGKAGIDPDGLRDTISRFNDAVRRSEDPLGRNHLPDPIETPPFYAVLTQGTTLGTHGGIAVDENLPVLNEEGEPIPGLYAAGEALGATATSGHDFASGMLLTPALSFGRILGRRLAPGCRTGG
jgi:fumarate reductase flavoprotein subunit